MTDELKQTIKEIGATAGVAVEETIEQAATRLVETGSYESAATPATRDVPMVIEPDGTKTTLAEYEQRNVSWMDGDPAALRAALDRRTENRRQLLEWIRDSLVEGIDFGRIHVVKSCKDKLTCKDPKHFSKPSLWKPGAEKIVGMLDMRAEWPELVDELRAACKPDAKNVAVRCVLYDRRGNIVGEGAGARSLDREYGDVNKAMKMAKKSSLIDAVLAAAGLSEVFTQDLGDDEGSTEPDGTLDETGQRYLMAMARKRFGDEAAVDVLAALARQYFSMPEGDWTKIPAWRLQDAIRMIDERAKQAEEDT